MAHDAWRAHALKNLDDGRDPYLLVCSLGGTKGHLYVFGAIETAWGILADVAVVAVVISLLAEVVEQYPSTTDARLSILLHALELAHVYILLSALASKLGKLDNISKRVE